ncbi:MAG: hypothetical protein BV456_10795 [Thermoplasmata archaeon M8B2D]|nr:MAG: hypothetical protein BV456_10795 [Thermoplasmata archaeon M8B2D]
MFGFFGQRRRFNELKEELKDSFDHVKKDFDKVGEWIKHLDDKNDSHEKDISFILGDLLSVKQDLAEIKEFVNFFSPQISGSLSKQTQTRGVKQTKGSDVQTGVQTGVQTEILSKLTVMERAIVWALINSEMNLSYEDLAALMGKDKSTIRGQINSIRQKDSGLIREVRETTGKKRLYIPESERFKILKRAKIKIKEGRKKKSED